jgi:pimeloyl-ACP methyl ester carboxylesterase
MTRHGGWISRIVGALFGLVLLVLLAGFTYEQIGRSHDASRLPQRIGRAIDIVGRTLNLYCSGKGSPTVIFETGGNGPGYEWASIQTKLANFTRACWYDRAGVGWSDPPQRPRTSATVVSDLHEALSRAGIPPPYVLVGASIGGEYARIYTSRYPHDVAGLVLVDSAHPDQQEPAFMLSPFNRMSPGARQLICTALPFMSRFGILRFMASRMRGPPPAQLSPEGERLAKLNSQPKALRTQAEEGCAATDGGRLVSTLGTGNPELDSAARNAGNLGDRPLVVLTAGRYWAPPGLEKEAAVYHEIWTHQLQASLARLSTRGQQVVVDAHHDMGEAPDAVVTATRQVVDEVRGEK